MCVFIILIHKIMIFIAKHNSIALILHIQNVNEQHEIQYQLIRDTVQNTGIGLSS